MPIYKRPAFAWAVLVLCAVLAIGMGQYKPLAAARQAVETQFYEGDDYGISGATQLQARRAATQNLITLARRAEVDIADPLRVLDASAALAVTPDAPIAQQLTADRSLSTATDTLYQALSRAPLSDSDRRLCEAQYTDFLAAADRFKRCGFFAAATAFNADFGGALYAACGVERYPLT